MADPIKVGGCNTSGAILRPLPLWGSGVMLLRRILESRGLKVPFPLYGKKAVLIWEVGGKIRWLPVSIETPVF